MVNEAKLGSYVSNVEHWVLGKDELHRDISCIFDCIS